MLLRVVALHRTKVPCGVIIRHITITDPCYARVHTDTPRPWPLCVLADPDLLVLILYVERTTFCAVVRGAWPSVCTEHTSLKCSVLQVRDCCTVSRNEIQRSITARPRPRAAAMEYSITGIRWHAELSITVVTVVPSENVWTSDTYNTPMHKHNIDFGPRG